MGTPLNRRPNSIFLSHSSRDKLDFVDGLYAWLTDKAALNVWYDRNMTTGPAASQLESAIDSSRSALIVFSQNAVQSSWVEKECNRLQEEEASYGGEFRIATMRLDTAEAPALFKAFKHIDALNGSLTADSAALLMESLFGGREVASGKTIYVSRGWKNPERPAAERICQALQRFGLKLVCDCTDQPRYDVERVRKIMSGTGGLAAIIPHRGSGATSPYITDEIRMARDAGLPVLAFTHREVVVSPEWSLSDALVFDDEIAGQSADEVADRFQNRIVDFERSWKKPARGEHIFLGHSMIDSRFVTMRRMLSRLTGLPVKVGTLVDGEDAPTEIVRHIRNADFCVIDISNPSYKELQLPEKINFGLNSCIEAGVAMGAGRDLYLTCDGASHQPPFMFRNKQVRYYEDQLGLVGHLTQIAAEHRRQVL